MSQWYSIMWYDVCLLLPPTNKEKLLKRVASFLNLSIHKFPYILKSKELMYCPRWWNLGRISWGGYYLSETQGTGGEAMADYEDILGTDEKSRTGSSLVNLQRGRSGREPGRLCWLNPDVARKFSFFVCRCPQRVLWKHMYGQVTSLEWLPISLRIETQLLTVANRAPASLAPMCLSSLSPAIHCPQRSPPLYALCPKRLNFSPQYSLCPFPPTGPLGYFYLCPDACPSSLHYSSFCCQLKCHLSSGVLSA